MHQHDYVELVRSLSAFIEPGTVFEVRILHANDKRTDSGYFSDVDQCATAIGALNEPYVGVYFTPNPVVSDLIARADNRIKVWAKNTTMDPDIIRRRWLLVDVDPKRRSGISSTQEQLDNAFKVGKRISNMLELEGWPRPYFNVSGNGVHLMYRIDEPNNDFVRDEIQKFLQVLDYRFKADGCEVDVGNFNASRIWRLPGTWARKGDSTQDRPHRKAYIVQVPDKAICVPISQIVAMNTRYMHLVEAAKPLKVNGTGHKNKLEYPDDERKFRSLHDQAMNRMSEWVPNLFPAAYEYKQGYRVKSENLGLHWEEDLTIHPMPLGIKYFGVADQGDATEGRRTPISLVAEHLTDGNKMAAAYKIAELLKYPVYEFDKLPAIAGLDGGLNGHSNGHSTLALPGIEDSRIRFDFTKMPNASDLLMETMPLQHWIIQNVLPTGNILLASRPKMMKTFLAIQLGIAIASGGTFLDWKCDQGDVLFLGLEDSKRRMKSRIKLLNTFNLSMPDLSGFRYFTGGVDISPTTGQQFLSNPEEAAKTYGMFPRGQAGIDALEQYLEAYPRTKLIVIDTFAHFRDNNNNSRDIYQRDYDQMMPLTRLAAKHQVLILPIHHEKKGLAALETGDFMEDVSGSTGITGAVDGVISIKGKRGPQSDEPLRKLLISGRDIPRDMDLEVKFEAQRGGWLMAAKQDTKLAIKALLEKYGALNISEVANRISNTPLPQIKNILIDLKFEGEVEYDKYKGYSLKRLP